MRKSFLVLVLLSTTCIANAQNVKLNWGPMYGKSTPKVLYYDTDSLKLYATYEITTVLPNINTTTPYLASYREDLETIKFQSFSAHESDKLVYRGIYSLGNYFLLLNSNYDKKSNRATYSYQRIDKDFKTDGFNTEIFSFEGKLDDYRQFAVRYSQDSSKICIIAGCGSAKKENIKLNIKVYDKDFNTLIDTKYEVPNSLGYKTRNVDKIVTNKGNVYFIFKESNNEKGEDFLESASGKKDSSGHKTVFVKFEGNKAPKELPIESDGKFVQGYLLAANNAGDPIVGIYYSEFYELKRYGIMVYKYDNATDAILLKTTNELPKTVTDQYTKVGGWPVGKKEDEKLMESFVEFKIYDDGSMVFVYEEDNWTSSISSIFVMKLNKNATIDWTAFIPRKAIRGYGSNDHATLFYKNQTCVFYNDDPDNANYDLLNSTKKPKTYNYARKEDFVMVTVDEKGNLKKSILNQSKNNNININVYYSTAISANRVFISGNDFFSNRVIYGSIDFN